MTTAACFKLPRFFPAFTLAAAGLVLATGCGRSVAFDDWAPGSVVVGNAETVVLTEGFGPWLDQERVLDVTYQELEDDGYFFLEDISLDGVALIESNGRLERSDGAALEPGKLYVALDVLETTITETIETEIVITESIDEQGNTVVTETAVEDTQLTANVTYAVTLITDQVVLLDMVEYSGQATGSLELSDDEILSAATEAAVRQVLGDITPRKVRYTLVLDDSDPALVPTLDVALDGNLDVAIADLEDRVANKPSHAAAQYNLGALYDAQRRYEQALVAYDAAIAHDDDARYPRARQGCQQRLENRELLSAPAQPNHGSEIHYR